MGKTSIEWTDYTFNPWWGCTKVSPACDHCYAETFSRRVGFSETGSKFPIWGKDLGRRFFGDKHWNEPHRWNEAAAKSGERKRVFCGSMCDVMEDRPDLDDARDRLCDLIYETPNLDWLLLTKRPHNFRRFLPPSMMGNPLPNVWLMTTVESPEYLWRIDALRECPAFVRGLSIEPLLADVPEIGEYLDGIDWCIVGGESGKRARPMHPSWVRRVRDECISRKIAFFFKQWGEWIPGERGGESQLPEDNGIPPESVGPSRVGWLWPDGEFQLIGNITRFPLPTVLAMKVGKKAAGSLLDDHEWRQVPGGVK